MDRVIETDVIVAGLGAVGAAIAYQLSRRGVDFVGIDRWAPPHESGSSHGQSRITREFVGEGPEYVPLVRRSHEIWADLEAKGHRLRERTGLLYLARKGGMARRHGAEDFIRATLQASVAASGRELPELDARALRRDYPQFRVADDTVGYLEPEAGFVRPEMCIAAQLAEVAEPARALVFGETITGLAHDGRGVRVSTDKAQYRASKVVLAMGAWLPAFVGGAFREKLQVLRQVQYWFRLDDPARWAGPRAPAFLWFHGDADADVFYGFPPIDGAASVKVATEQYVTTCDPDSCERRVSEAEAAAMFETHVRGQLQGVSRELVAATTCFYTFNTEGPAKGRFMIGPHPTTPGVTVVSACSGHGFKHSAGLGEAVVQQLLGEPSAFDLTLFAP
ncbi:N-methyl-L-tryptophan oxidase [Phenylobacterium sp.]|uniref:N-methyl-L-tryptophan oxidase n=1 Tax=Phenylobacterium sp. TaxID=1871053 RepID=UPI0025F69CE7|nr:N-methyl-L-tryptophan oxidase [Phenylobacterium sp.]